MMAKVSAPAALKPIRKRLTKLIGFRGRKSLHTAPGTMRFDPTAEKSVVKVITYDDNELVEEVVASPKDIAQHRRAGRVLWLNVDGLGDAAMIRAIASAFELHPLAMEDALNVHQRPKADDFEKHVFVVVRMASHDAGRLVTEQVSVFLGRDFVITFQESPGDCFEPVRNRLRKNRGRIRALGADYLAYALLDTVVDFCFPVLEMFGDRIEALEEEVLDNPDPSSVARIHEARRDLIGLRRAMWPLREMLSGLYRDPRPYISTDTQLYLRDCYDHSIQIIDLVESYRELVSGLLDVYLSSVSNRMNEIMKVLTLIATIFIPLGFIAGVYGMNFDPARSPLNMPELSWYFGYPFALGLMALTALGFVVYFYRRGWIGKKSVRHR